MKKNKPYTHHWQTPEPRAAILLVHGLGEHCRRYDHLAAFFNQHDIAVVGYDHPGHGQTEGKRGYVPNLETLMDGVEQMLAETRTRYPAHPVFIYGHSMGGNVSLNCILKRKPDISGAIISAPHIRSPIKISPLLIALGRMMNKIAPRASRSNGLDPHLICRDEKVVQQYIKDPLVHDQLTYALAVAMLDGAAFLDRYEGQAPIPLLLMHGTADGITSCVATREFAERLKADVSFKEWKDFYHEIHNEKQQKEVFVFALEWINKHLNKHQL